MNRLTDRFYESEIIDNIKNIADKINDENNKQIVDKDKVTKLMFSQLMAGLYLQNIMFK